MTTNPVTPQASPALQKKILATIKKKTFCTLATSSPAGFSHSAGVVYEAVDGVLWIHVSGNSRKALNVSQNNKVGVCIPFRRMPVGPPYTIHFQARAEIVPMDAPEVKALLEAGKLAAIAGHGALDMPDGCFMRITPRGSINSFGPGARIIDLVRDPLNSGARTFRLTEAAA